jgi:sortase A
MILEAIWKRAGSIGVKQKEEDRMSENKNKKKEKKRSILQKVFLALIFALGLSIFLYPSVTNFINSRIQDQVIEGYKENIEKLREEEVIRLRKEAIAYNDKLTGGTVIIDPFSENRPRETGVSYMDMLNIGEVMAYVEIPKIDVHLPVYHGTSDDVLNNGLGHIEQTSLPIGGFGTNSVITGHRGLPTAKMFRNLDEMEIGDEFYIHSLDEVLAYEIFDIVIVPPTDIERLRIEKDKDIVTLITCDPYMINTNRLLVRGLRTDYIAPVEYAEGGDGEIPKDISEESDEGVVSSAGELSKIDRHEWMILFVAALSVAVIILTYHTLRIRKERGKKVMEREA